jgi:tetratricopeptide (TPR) repeat protein
METPPPTARQLDVAQAIAAADEMRRHGRLRDAEKLLGGVLQLDPRHFGALHRLGTICAQQNRPVDAEGFLRRALAVDPGSIAVRGDLGFVLAGQGRLEEARAEFAGILDVDPDQASAHNNLGNVLHAMGRSEEAVGHFELAVALKPDHAEIGVNLANALAALKRHEAAVLQLEGALAVDANAPRVHRKLADLLTILKRHAEAVFHYRKAVELKPDDAKAHSNMGHTLDALGRHEESLACFRRALAIAPKLAEAHAGEGHALLILGRTEEARAAFEKSVELAPRRGDFRLGLAEAMRFSEGDPQLASMTALAEDIDALAENERMPLHFALGKAYADVGAHEKAFPHFLAGNAQRRREFHYDEVGTLAMMERVKAAFTRELFRQKAGLGDASEIPVFIVGMPRSGTTLVEQMLAAHPKVIGAGEPEWMSSAAQTLQSRDGLGFPELIPALGASELRAVASAYLDALGAYSPGFERVVDKMPSNFLLVGLIHLVFPNARIVHIARDPVDTCVSCFSKLFGRGVLYSYDLAELGRYYVGYRSVMARWRDVLPSGAMIDVLYEDLVADFETEARRIVAFAGLEWDARCLRFHETVRPVLTASALQVRRPVYKDSVGRWQAYAPMMGPLLDALNESRAAIPQSGVDASRPKT